MNDLICTLADTFSQELGSQLKAIYRFDNLLQGVHQPGETITNVLVVTEPGTDIHHIRRFFQPFWAQHGTTLGRAPLLAPEPMVRRHVALHPLFAEALQQADLVAGASDLVPDQVAISFWERLAVLAAETMRVSVCLTPELLDEATTVATQARLRNLASVILGRAVDPEETAVTLLSQLYQHLQNQLAEVNHLNWEPLVPPDDPLLPNLEAAYKYLGQLVMTFEHFDADLVTAVDWHTIAQSLTGQYTGLQITTSTLLQFIVTYETPLPFALRNFHHDWGVNPLSDVELNKPLILREAARKPSTIYLDSLTHTYLTEPESEDHTIIHDFRNKILNIQLEHELLHRLHQIPRFIPPEPLPDRDIPASQRIDAIYQHLDWWASYYWDSYHPEQINNP